MARKAEYTENLFPILNSMIGIEACDAGILSNLGLICLRDLWLNEKRTTVVYKAINEKHKYTTQEVVQ